MKIVKMAALLLSAAWLVCCCAVASALPIKDSADFGYKYECDAVSDPGYSLVPESIFSVVDPGILNYDTSTTSGYLQSLQFPTAFASSSAGVTFEIRMKATEAGAGSLGFGVMPA